MKETIIQFGEGGFLRSFADVFVHKMNEQGLYDGKVVVVQPIAKGLIPVLNEQKGVYHQFLRGIEAGLIYFTYQSISIKNKCIYLLR